MASAVDPEMKRRFDAAEKIRIHATPLARPTLAPSADSLRAHFASPIGRAETPLENPHVEPRVSEADRARAIPASVLIACVLRDSGPSVIVTQRPTGISFPGHWVFPGGRADPGETPLETALREAEEEIGLARDRLEVIGRLGDYVSHSGFRVVPTVALVEAPVELRAHPAEVDAIAEVPLTRFCDPRSYFLFRFRERPTRAHFALETGYDDVLLTGVTCSIAIGLYGQLLRTHVG
jgi:8-oxo-dGTP pyrophosphatase MutT (NUDIX family)